MRVVFVGLMSMMDEMYSEECVAEQIILSRSDSGAPRHDDDLIAIFDKLPLPSFHHPSKTCNSNTILTYRFLDRTTGRPLL